jgi:hypothetical protein
VVAVANVVTGVFEDGYGGVGTMYGGKFEICGPRLSGSSVTGFLPGTLRNTNLPNFAALDPIAL